MHQHTSAYLLCRHTKTDGHRCQSPAQGSSAFCYHHRNLRRTPRRTRRPAESSAIEQAMGIIGLQADTGRIHPYDASLMLQALEYASTLHRTQAESRS